MRRQKKRLEEAERHPRGDELDLLMVQDRLWFEAHPDRQYRARFAAPVELFELDNYGDGLPEEAVAVVTFVKRIGPA